MASRLLLPRGYRNAEVLQRNLHNQDEQVWVKRGERRALAQFHAMAARVPAYKDFLKANNFDSSSVKTIKDFQRIPKINKDNYLRKYPKEMLCWDGEFSHGQWVISTTSGSTGEPYYFPRESTQDWQYAISAELYLRNNFDIQSKSTLYIVAFPMGAWIGGLFTYEALKLVTEHGGYDMSIITPGIHKQEVINAIKQLAGSFDQVIIGAYAPFLKDILDDGTRQGIDWSKLNLGFVFSAEAFTETFRNFVLKKTGISDPYRSSLNHYGTVDIGTMAHETPESIYVRRKLLEKESLKLLLPEATKQPTLCQYNPELFYFEEEENNLLCTSYSGLPLVRYDLKDFGGVISRSHVHSVLKEAGIDFEKDAQSYGFDKTTWSLPYVYVYERNDFSVSYYAFLIYPDTIRRALQQNKFEDVLTGKFTMYVDYDEKGRQHLNIHAELTYGQKQDDNLVNQLSATLHDALLKESSEYRETFGMIGAEARPIVMLWDYESPEYFRPGTKQKWVKK